MAEEAGYSAEAAMAMLLFSLASSSLLLVNKLCLHYFPVPAFVSTMQFVSAAATSMGLMASGVIAKDGWEWRKIKPYLVYVCMFVATIYANMRALQHSNVETIIVFRSACPLIVCVLDWGFLGRQLPSARSVGALLVIIGGCVGYVLTDRAFKLNGWGAYTWVTAYFLIISVEMAYGKHIVGPHLAFNSMWGPTLYTNTLSVPPMVTIGLLSHELDKFGASEWNTASTTLLLASCVIGVAISYLGWRARSLVTATCYTVLGVANKMFTVLANAMVWDQRASMTGILFLVVCLVGAAGYKQAPMAESSEGSNAARSRGSRKIILVASGLIICVTSALMLAQAGSAGAPPSMLPAVPPSAAPYYAAPLPAASKGGAAVSKGGGFTSMQSPRHGGHRGGSGGSGGLLSNHSKGGKQVKVAKGGSVVPVDGGGKMNHGNTGRQMQRRSGRGTTS